MLRKVMLINRSGKSLGVLAVDEKDTIVHYGGGYFARDEKVSTCWRGELMPIFRQPDTIYCTNKLDHEFPARIHGQSEGDEPR